MNTLPQPNPFYKTFRTSTHRSPDLKSLLRILCTILTGRGDQQRRTSVLSNCKYLPRNPIQATLRSVTKNTVSGCTNTPKRPLPRTAQRPDSQWNSICCRGRDRTPPTPKEQPPRKLSGKRTATAFIFWKESPSRWPPTG
jgi:hypothetical protein